MLPTSRSVARASRSSHLSNLSTSSNSSVRCFSCTGNPSSVNDVLNRISTASSSQRQQAQSQSRPVQAAAASQSSTSQLPLKTPSSPIQDSSSPSGRTPTFRNGQLYDPSSLSPPTPSQDRPSYYRAQPLLGPTKAMAIKSDPIHLLNLHPSKPSLSDDSYKNGALLSSYVSEMGRILPRSQTRLTRRSQREIGKAVRRARNMGLVPTMSRGKRGGGWQ